MSDDDREQDDVHVMPLYGPEHDCSRRCWSRPVRDEEEPRVWVHRDPN